MAKAIKQKEWQDALEKVAQITDKLGMLVDEEIAETVAMLYLIGFMTTSSCGGHSNRINEGPFVIIGSPKAIELEKELAAATNHDSHEYIQIRNEISLHRIDVQTRLFHLLNTFYSSRKQVFGRMLTLRSIGYSSFRLNCQGSELAYSENSQERILRIDRNRSEMKAFTEWLKQCYLEPFNSHGLEWDTLNGSLFVGQPAKEYSKIISELSDTLEKSASVHAATVFDGCFDGFNGGPYIVFESPKAEEVRKTVIAAEGNLKSEERSALYKKAMQYNTDDQRRLYRLLEDFYALHNTEYEQMLEVQTVGFSNFRLRYQGAESMLLDSVDARMRRLKTNCGDMKMLIEYLKK